MSNHLEVVLLMLMDMSVLLAGGKSALLQAQSHIFKPFLQINQFFIIPLLACVSFFKDVFNSQFPDSGDVGSSH